MPSAKAGIGLRHYYPPFYSHTTLFFFPYHSEQNKESPSVLKGVFCKSYNHRLYFTGVIESLLESFTVKKSENVWNVRKAIEFIKKLVY